MIKALAIGALLGFAIALAIWTAGDPSGAMPTGAPITVK